jgi:hypothetical protein
MKFKVKVILFSLLCMLGAAVYAAPVSPSIAQQIADNFWIINAGKSSQVSLTNVTAQSGFQELYIFTHPAGKGFVIVAADDCVQPVIAYSLKSRFNFPLPAHVQDFLQGYESEIAYCKTSGKQATAEIVELWQSMLNGTYTLRNTNAVAPLLTTTWNQGQYYNELCPDSAGVHTVTGCVATATAQVMKYWNWPVTGTGSYSYDHERYGTLTADFGATSYNWSMMPNALTSSSSEAQVNAVATLMFHLGVATEMDYDFSASSAYINSHNIADLPCSENALKDYFGYRNTIHSVYKEGVTDAEWMDVLTDELDAGRPVLESGHGGGGHAFVCDGYDNNGLFHINWGWGGLYDGYFAHNALNPGGGGTGSGSTHSYNDNQSLVVGIEPEGLLRTNISYIALPQEGGTASFTVNSDNTSDSAWSAVSSEPWLTVSPSNGPGLGVVTTVSVNASPNNTGTSRTAIVTITQDTQSVVLTVAQNECAAADMCMLSLLMEDSFGDGWNGAYLTLTSSSGFVYGTATCLSSAAETQQFNVCPSDLILTWNSGEYDYECSFTLFDPQGQYLLNESVFFSPSYTVPNPCDALQPSDCEIVSFPWNESFEFEIDCWTMIDADGDGEIWHRSDVFPYEDGVFSMRSYSYIQSPLNADNYLVSPKITLPNTGTYQLIFYARSANNSYPDSLWVRLSTTDNSNVSAFNTVLMPKTMIPQDYQSYTVSLSGYNGQSFYLAFEHNSYNGYYLILDNISIVNELQTYTIIATSSDTSMGTVTGGGSYIAGTEVSLEATANEGYRFMGWNDGSTDNPRVFSVLGDASYIGYFADLGTNELHYDNGVYFGSMGGGGALYWAVKLPASVLSPYNTLSSVRLWDVYAGSYEVRVYQGGTNAPGTQIYTQTYSLNGNNAWYDAVFSSPVAINSSEALWIVLYNANVTHPAAGSTYVGNPDGSWVSLDGDTWSSVYDAGYPFTWMLRPVLSSGSPVQTYTITAVAADTTMGVVIGSGTYAAGSTIQLIANPNPGYDFLEWQDGNTSNPRSITVTGDMTYTAFFQAATSTCVINSLPWSEGFEEGWNCWTTIDVDGDGHAWGRVFNTNFSYEGNYVMYSLSYDGETNTGLDAENYLVSPEIVLPEVGNHQLSFYARSGHSSYLDTLLVKLSTTGNVDVADFNVTLMPKTVVPSTYEHYTIDLSAYNGQSIYVAFVHDSYDDVVLLIDNVVLSNIAVSCIITATSADDAMGMALGSGTYISGEEVTLEAVAYAGYRFTGWNDGSTENPRRFAAMGNASYTANFANLGTNELHYDNGTFTSSMGAGGTLYWAVRFPASVLTLYNSLSSVRLWDAFAGSYEIRVCQGGTNAPGTQIYAQTFTLRGTDNWYEAEFSEPLSINPSQALWIVVYNADVNHPAAASTYAGNPDGSWISMDGVSWNSICAFDFFLSWMVRPMLTGASGQIYTITAMSSDNALGEVAGGGPYVTGSTAQLIATPAANCHFVSWDDGNTDNPRFVTVTGDATYIANFALDQYQLTVLSSNGAMGEAFGSGLYDYGSVIQIRANPHEGYEFQCWDDGNVENPRDVTVLGNMTYTANFQPTGISGVDLSSILVYSQGMQIAVCHAEGESIKIYDMQGKLVVYDALNTQENRVFAISAKGIYLVQVGDSLFKKVIVK